MDTDAVVNAANSAMQVGGNRGEAKLLYGAYYNSLRRAQENGCKSVAFPLISAGIFGYPVKEAWEIAIKAVRDFQEQEDAGIMVRFAVLDDNIKEIGDMCLILH